ncbi:hypothetical protein NESM_000165300 [Novymonas esmeraldas]|uniref:PH domain-containing protein n=1 Tax=Novymonas esmeraldas TaxID=1808958 RepID=A0AAW0F454_9TRYP
MPSPAADAPTRRKRTSKPGGSATAEKPKEAPKRIRPQRMHVSFADDTQTVHVARDQENPTEVWNMYSHVAYTTKKEQRFLQRCLHSRIHEVIDHCPSLFPLPDDEQEGRRTVPISRSGRRIDGSLVSALRANGYGKSIAACAMYVLSVWPSFPPKQRPPLSAKVQRAMEALQAGTQLYVFNEKPNSPLRCGTSLRLLHGIDAGEASVAIFNAAERTVIDGYIPLSFIVSLSFGLEAVERERYLKKTGKITCTDGTKKVEETSKRAFTLHCAAPEKFYVTFIAATQEDFDNWTRVIDYFVLLNSSCRTYMQSR